MCTYFLLQLLLTMPDTFWQKQRTLLAQGKYRFKVHINKQLNFTFFWWINLIYFSSFLDWSVDGLAKVVDLKLPLISKGNLHYKSLDLVGIAVGRWRVFQWNTWKTHRNEKNSEWSCGAIANLVYNILQRYFTWQKHFNWIWIMER